MLRHSASIRRDNVRRNTTRDGRRHQTGHGAADPAPRSRCSARARARTSRSRWWWGRRRDGSYRPGRGPWLWSRWALGRDRGAVVAEWDGAAAARQVVELGADQALAAAVGVVGRVVRGLLVQAVGPRRDAECVHLAPHAGVGDAAGRVRVGDVRLRRGAALEGSDAGVVAGSDAGVRRGRGRRGRGRGVGRCVGAGVAAGSDVGVVAGVDAAWSRGWTCPRRPRSPGLRPPPGRQALGADTLTSRLSPLICLPGSVPDGEATVSRPADSDCCQLADT